MSVCIYSRDTLGKVVPFSKLFPVGFLQENLTQIEVIKMLVMTMVDDGGGDW